MTKPPVSYSPINCEFHDVIEATATRRHAAAIRFVDEDGVPRDRHARIVTVFARAGAEWLELDTGEHIRLDRLLSIDGEQLADYTPPT